MSGRFRSSTTSRTGSRSMRSSAAAPVPTEATENPSWARYASTREASALLILDQEDGAGHSAHD